MREEKLGRTGKAAETISSLQVKVQTWPTPRSEDSESCGNHPGATDSLTGATRQWRTPNTRDHHAQGLRSDHAQRQTTLVDQVNSQWQTPNVPNGGRTLTPEEIAAKGKTENGKRQVGLENEARNWATPNARDTHNPSKPEDPRSLRKAEQGWTVDLNEQAAWWGAESARPTPNACDGSKVSQISHQGACLTRSAEAEFRYSLPDQETPTHGGTSSPSGQTSRRRLNPAFVEWLMGWPQGWTDFAPLEMESWRCRGRRHLESWLRERD
jgi:hypothetical protein